MSRTPARGAIIASGAVSVVASLCLLGAVAGASAAQTAETADNSPVLQHSGGAADDNGSMSGSHDGWLDVEGAAVFRLLRPASPASPSLAAQGLSTSGSAEAEQVLLPAKAAQPPAVSGPAPAAAPAVREQSRSAALSAVSGQPRDIAQALAATRGWTGAQWTCLDKLWDHESKFETTVRNARSGAYGIPQALPASKMASAGADWRTNPVTQVVWGLGYIDARYGSPCDAWSYWLKHSSY